MAPQPVVAQPVPAGIPATPPAQAAPVAYDNFGIAGRQAHDFASFKTTFNQSLAKLVDEGKVTVDYLNQLKTYFQVAEIWQVNDAQKAEMFDQFCAQGWINKVGG